MTSTVEYNPPFSTAIRSRSRISALSRCGQSTLTEAAANGETSAGECACGCECECSCDSECDCDCGEDDGSGGDDDDEERVASRALAFELQTHEPAEDDSVALSLSAAMGVTPFKADDGAPPSHDGRRDVDDDDECCCRAHPFADTPINAAVAVTVEVAVKVADSDCSAFAVSFAAAAAVRRTRARTRSNRVSSRC